MALELYDDFEDSDFSEWNINATGWSRNNNYAYTGTYSANVNINNGTYLIASTTFNDPLTKFEVYWLEDDGSSYGGGYSLLNSNGNRVITVGSNNPQWIYTDGSSAYELYAGDGYWRWIRTTVTLDDANNQAQIEFHDTQSGTTKSVTASYDNSGPVTQLELTNTRTQGEHADQTLTETAKYNQWTDNIQVEYETTSIPQSPSSASLTVNANDSIDLTVDPPSDWGGEVGSYEIELERDGSGYSDPAGGPSTPSGSTSTQTYNYGPNSDTAYDRQVGIDSSFKFRVRATNSVGASGWTYSGTVYTDPIPPHNPSVSRPDANTFTISWVQKSDNCDWVDIYAREDTGSGYGTWNKIYNKECGSKGTNYSVTIDTTTSLKFDWSSRTLNEDSRYQFKVESYAHGRRSHQVVSDYGNEGNVYFEDDFESGDLSAWDTATLNDSNSGVYSGTNAPGTWDAGISGADSGTYYAWLESGDSAVKNLGDLSNQSDVIVKCAMAVGSMDYDGESVGLSWYTGSVWASLQHFSYEYNKQGWVEVTALVSSNWLSTDNRLRLTSTGGSGDHLAVDRVVVSDILHEYTKPTAPNGLSLDTSTERQITGSWINNANFIGYSGSDNNIEVWLKKTSENEYSNINWFQDSSKNSHTFSGLIDGEEYKFRVSAEYIQHRHGSRSNWFDASDITATAITILPSETPSASTASSTSVDVSWSDIWNNENGIRVDYSTDGGATWTQFSDLPPGSTSETITGLSENAYYQIRIEPYTDHTASPSGSTTVYIPLVLGAEKGVIEASGIQTQGEVTAVASGLGEISPSGVTGDQIRIKKATPEVGSISVGEISALPYEVVTLKRSVFDGNSPTLRIEDNEVQPSESSALTTNSATLASTEVYMKQSDTHPPLKAKLNGIDSNEFYHADIQAVVKHQGNSEVVVNTPVDEKDEIEKEVIYYWSQDGTDLPYTGTYQVEFQVTYADGRTETFPSEGYLSFDVEQRLS